MSDKANNPLISGDESAISIHTLNNNTTNNTDNTRNIVNQNTNHVVHNNTIVYQGAAATKQMSSSAREEYRRFCANAITSSVISRQTRLTLNERADELGINAQDREQIERTIIAKLKAAANSLSEADKSNLSLVIAAIRNNDASYLISSLPRLIAMADKSDNENVQFYAHLIMTVYKPPMCVQRYERRQYDSYWLTFWSYMSYKRLGDITKAEAVLAHISDWNDSPEKQGQELILNAAGFLYDYYARRGTLSTLSGAMSILLSTESLKFSSRLNPFVDTCRLLLKEHRPLYFSGTPLLRFYLTIFEAKNRPEPVAHSITSYEKTSNKKESISTIQDKWNQIQDKWNHFCESLDKFIDSHVILVLISPFLIIAITFIWLFIAKPVFDNQKPDTPLQEQTVTEPLSTDVSEDKIAPAPATKGNSSAKATPPNSSTQRKTSSPSPIKRDAKASEPSVTPSPTPQPAMSRADRLRNEAEAGNAKAAYELGEMHLYGNGGVAKSNSQAFSYFYQSAQGGNVSGMYWCGWCYRMGRGTTKNIPQARIWWEKAAAAGSSKAAQGLKELESLM